MSCPWLPDARFLMGSGSAGAAPDATYGTGYTGFFQTLQVWRQQAWQNAELLGAAKDQATFSAVSAQIEAAATARGEALAAANAATPASTASRDSYCATHWNSPAPMPYPWGTPSPIQLGGDT